MQHFHTTLSTESTPQATHPQRQDKIKTLFNTTQVFLPLMLHTRGNSILIVLKAHQMIKSRPFEEELGCKIGNITMQYTLGSQHTLSPTFQLNFLFFVVIVLFYYFFPFLEAAVRPSALRHLVSSHCRRRQRRRQRWPRPPAAGGGARAAGRQ